jgi:hypothetical protein
MKLARENGQETYCSDQRRAVQSNWSRRESNPVAGDITPLRPNLAAPVAIRGDGQRIGASGRQRTARLLSDASAL